jgi:hypothetical protein
MEEPVTYCVGSSGRLILDRGAPDIRRVERIVDFQTFGQSHDYEWTPAGLAHADCRLPRSYRFVGDDSSE